MCKSTSKNILKKAVLYSEKEKPSRSKLEECRTAIIYLKEKKYTLKQISAFLKENDISITPATISRYLKKYPAAEVELEKIREENNKGKSKTISEIAALPSQKETALDDKEEDWGDIKSILKGKK